MQEIYIIFPCPEPSCNLGAKVVRVGKMGSWFECKTHGRIHSDRMKFLLTEKKLKNKVVYRLLPDLSFITNILIQNSNMDPSPASVVSVEECGGLAQEKRIILTDINNKQRVEIFRGSKFSEKNFKKKIKRLSLILGQ